jgi:methylmalonyl-CoA/ethylmalonyl-CoA epimerase
MMPAVDRVFALSSAVDGKRNRCRATTQEEARKMHIGRLNHVAIAVKDIAKAAGVYRDTLGAEISAAVAQPEHGVTTVFVLLPNTKIELLEPLGEGSPIAKFLERSPDGGIHHLCYEVDDIKSARDRLMAQGVRVLGDGEPKIGAHGKPVLFLHPKDLCGTLIEIEQA